MLRIIISPAKKMNIIEEFPCSLTDPVFLEDSLFLHGLLREMSMEDLKTLWQCSDKLATQNYDRLHTFSPERAISPALLAYEGIQYQYIAPQVFSETQWAYVSQHLRILSGFYGILKPTDRVFPYRLEMQARMHCKEKKDLYSFWHNRLYTELIQAETAQVTASSLRDPLVILNLASAEYSKAVLSHITPSVSLVSCIFGEKSNGKIKVKATLAKMARGEMVRWMSENQIENTADIQQFQCLGFTFDPSHSTDTEYVFLK